LCFASASCLTRDAGGAGAVELLRTDDYGQLRRLCDCLAALRRTQVDWVA